MKWLCSYRITRQNLTRLTEAMQSEVEAIVYYEQLLRITQDHENTRILSDILADEHRHLKELECLYHEITGCRLTLPQPITPYIITFCDGLMDAFFDELNAYEFYRNVYLANQSWRRSNVFFANMSDENEHAMKLNYLIGKMTCRRRPHYTEEELHNKKQERKEARMAPQKTPMATASPPAEMKKKEPPMPPNVAVKPPQSQTPLRTSQEMLPKENLVKEDPPKAEKNQLVEKVQEKEQEKVREKEQEKVREKEQEKVHAGEGKKFELEVELGVDVDVDVDKGIELETNLEMGAEVEIETERQSNTAHADVMPRPTPHKSAQSFYPTAASAKDNSSLNRIDHLWEFAKKEWK